MVLKPHDFIKFAGLPLLRPSDPLEAANARVFYGCRKCRFVRRPGCALLIRWRLPARRSPETFPTHPPALSAAHSCINAHKRPYTGKMACSGVSACFLDRILPDASHPSERQIGPNKENRPSRAVLLLFLRWIGWRLFPFCLCDAHILPQKSVYKAVDGLSFAGSVRLYGGFLSLWYDNAQLIICLGCVSVFNGC